MPFGKGAAIPDNVVVDKVIMVINQSQAYKEAYKSFKALTQADQDFAHVITHFKAVERLRKECKDTAQDRGYEIDAAEAAMEGATRGLTDLANSIQQRETANAGSKTANNNGMLQEIRDGLFQVQQQVNQQGQQLAGNMQQPFQKLDNHALQSSRTPA